MVATVGLFCDVLRSWRSLRSCPEQARLGPELELTQVVHCQSLHIQPECEGLRRDLKKDRIGEKRTGQQLEGQSSGQGGHRNAQVNPLSRRVFVFSSVVNLGRRRASSRNSPQHRLVFHQIMSCDTGGSGVMRQHMRHIEA